MTKHVEILIFPGFQLLDAAGPIAAFEVAGRAGDVSPYKIVAVASRHGSVRSSSGVNLVAEKWDSGPLDTLIVVGGLGVNDFATNDATIQYVRDAANRARRVASVCSGAFVLGAAGLLDGKRATTHWGRCEELAATYPKARILPDQIFVRDGSIWTSAGISAGIDLSLALIADDLGEPAAKRVAQQLVVFYRRPGGQSQFSMLLEASGKGSKFTLLLAWARERLSESLTVERLADRSAMSPRNFARAFSAEIGMTPAKAIEKLRLETARELIETTSEPIDSISVKTGFGTQESMRRTFIRVFSQPPQVLRRLARSA